MSFESWVLVIGGVLLGMGLTARYVISLPFTATMVYLVIGILLGPIGWVILLLGPRGHTPCPYCGATLTLWQARCGACGASMTWIRGKPLGPRKSE